MWDYYFNKGATLMNVKAYLNNNRAKLIVVVSIKNYKNCYSFKKSEYAIF